MIYTHNAAVKKCSLGSLKMESKNTQIRWNKAVQIDL